MSPDSETNPLQLTLGEVQALLAACATAQEDLDLKPAALDSAWSKLEAWLGEHEPLPPT